MSKMESKMEPEITVDVEKSQRSVWERLQGQRVDLNELGKEYYQKALQFDEAQLQRDSIKVRRKLDFIVLPIMMTTYMLSFLDKQT